MDMDRELIASAVEHELYRHEAFRGNWSALERASTVSHSVMSRLKRADERVSQASFRKIEAAMGLPMDTLTAIGQHDLDSLRELGAPDQLIRWLSPKMAATG